MVQQEHRAVDRAFEGIAGTPAAWAGNLGANGHREPLSATDHLRPAVMKADLGATAKKKYKVTF